MKRLPSQLADLLRPEHKHLCDEDSPVTEAQHAFRPGTSDAPRWAIPDAFEPSQVANAVELFANVFDNGKAIPRLTTPCESYWGDEEMTRFCGQGQNFHTVYNSANLTGCPQDVHQELIDDMETIGIGRLMRSESAINLVKNLTGYTFDDDPNGMFQLSCYEHGDYVGAHNDFYSRGRKGSKRLNYFIDLHSTFLSPHAMMQAVMYHTGEFFNGFSNAAANPSSLVLYRLPFWHQVGPLQVLDPADRDEARRWLIMSAYFLDKASCDVIDAEPLGHPIAEMYRSFQPGSVSPKVNMRLWPGNSNPEAK